MTYRKPRKEIQKNVSSDVQFNPNVPIKRFFVHSCIFAVNKIQTVLVV